LCEEIKWRSGSQTPSGRPCERAPPGGSGLPNGVSGQPRSLGSDLVTSPPQRLRSSRNIVSLHQYIIRVKRGDREDTDACLRQWISDRRQDTDQVGREGAPHPQCAIIALTPCVRRYSTLQSSDRELTRGPAHSQKRAGAHRPSRQRRIGWETADRQSVRKQLQSQTVSRPLSGNLGVRIVHHATE